MRGASQVAISAEIISSGFTLRWRPMLMYTLISAASLQIHTDQMVPTLDRKAKLQKVYENQITDVKPDDIDHEVLFATFVFHAIMVFKGVNLQQIYPAALRFAVDSIILHSFPWLATATQIRTMCLHTKCRYLQSSTTTLICGFRWLWTIQSRLKFVWVAPTRKI